MTPNIYTLSLSSIFHKVEFRLFLQVLGLTCLLLSSSNAFSSKFYSRANGDWTDPNTWGSDTCGEKISVGSIPVAGDDVFICDGYSVTISENVACENLFIGGGSTGLLQFGFSQSATLTVSGDIIVNNGALLQYAFNSGKRHFIHLAGNFINNGNVKLGFDNDDYVTITFNGTGQSNVAGKGSWTSLGYMILDKESKSEVVRINSSGFGSALTAGAAALSTPKSVGKNPPVVFICGTFIYNIPDNLSNLINPGASGDPSFTIPRNVVFQIEQGTVDMASFPGIGEMGDCVLEGHLIVNGGTVNISKGTSSSWNVGLFYCGNAPETPKLTINGGTVNCYGAFTSWTSDKDDIGFTMTGGFFIVNMGTIPTEMETFWITDHEGSAVNFTGGTVVVQNKSTHAASFTFSDFDIGGSKISNFNVSGTATVQFGNESTSASQVMRFSAYADVLYPHVVKFDAVEGNSITVKPFNAADFKLLSYNDENQ